MKCDAAPHSAPPQGRKPRTMAGGRGRSCRRLLHPQIESGAGGNASDARRRAAGVSVQRNYDAGVFSKNITATRRDGSESRCASSSEINAPPLLHGEKLNCDICCIFIQRNDEAFEEPEPSEGATPSPRNRPAFPLNQHHESSSSINLRRSLKEGNSHGQDPKTEALGTD